MPKARVKAKRSMRLERVCARRTKEQRQKDRQKAGPLRNSVVREGTGRRYQLAMMRFTVWLRLQNRQCPRTPAQADTVIPEYIEMLWAEGEPKAWAGDTVSAMLFFYPCCSRRLTDSWRLSNAWGKAELPCRAPPFLNIMIYALVHFMMSQKWHDTALLLVLCFIRLLAQVSCSACEFAILSAQEARSCGY